MKPAPVKTPLAAKSEVRRPDGSWLILEPGTLVFKSSEQRDGKTFWQYTYFDIKSQAWLKHMTVTPVGERPPWA